MLTLRPSRLVPLALAAAVGLASAPARADDASRWIAALPFGAGQFQNGKVGLGIFFAVSEGVLGGASIATAAATNALASPRPNDVRSLQQLSSVNASIHAVTMANWISFTGFATLAVTGVVEAQVNFAPRRDAPTDRRGMSLAPIAAPLPGGGLLGVHGTF